MKLEIKSPGEMLNKAYALQSPGSNELTLFSANLSALLEYLQGGAREEHQKTHIRDFLNDTWYKKTNLVNIAGDIDLAIYAGLSADTVSVIIETKSSFNAVEMLTQQKPNAKALHEVILYYLREVVDKGNYEIKHLIVTNTWEWFIFDGVWFERNVRRNPELVKAYKAFKPDGHDNRHFYESVARPWLEDLSEPVPCCWFDLRDYKTIAQTTNLPEKDKKKLIELYKLLAPQHLLKLPFSNDSNSLNSEFYGELLHIVGLEEVKEKGKKLIRRKAPERRDEGSLLENTINLLKVQQSLEGIRNLQDYGADGEDQYFSVALELCITWLNRILFLKLLEGRLIAWNQDDSKYAFLNRDRIKDFDELQELFFEVLARQECDRTNDIKAKFGNIPYLNSSLFEVSPLERTALQISGLKHRLTMSLYPASVLKTDAGKRRGGESNTLIYLFEFLDAYDFASEGKALVKETPKTIINASVLGLIFEKINGYRDGSFYTPGYITMQMSRVALRRAVLLKLNTHFGWSCKDFTELHNALSRVDIKEANAVVNSLKVCDPAVGSGHFLVSALNEIIAIKAELRILMDKDGRLLRDYSIAVANDELTVLDGTIPFVYRPGNEESQRVQETLFREKATVIENCLFGVDINQKSVAICRLRLWIELLKNAYYRTTPNPLLDRKEGAFSPSTLSSPPVLGGAGGGKVLELETLPNIDINIKCGNSLISRFSLSDDKTGLAHYAPVERRRLKELTRRYKEKVWFYKLGEKGPSNKQILRREIEAIKEEWRTFSLPSDFFMKELLNIQNELLQPVFAFDEVGQQKREKLHQRATELEEKIAARQRTVYANAFEWRFEFPEVLDEEGDFTGFDVVIGNPPYGVKFQKAELSECLERYPEAEKIPDSYCFFMVLAFNLLRQTGILSLIVPNTFCDLESGEKFRRVFLHDHALQWIWQTGWAFDSAVVDTLVFQAVNEKAAKNSAVTILLEEQEYTRQLSEFLANRLAKIDYRNQPGKLHLLHKIRHNSVLLGDIADIKAGVIMYEKGKGTPPQNEKTFEDRPFSVTGHCPEGWKPLFRGTDVTRFTLNQPNEFVNYGPWLAAPRNAEMFDSPKLLMRRTDDRLMCALEENSAICVKSCHVIKHKPDIVPQFPYEFLMAILNSRLTQYYFELSNPQMQGKVFAEIKVVYVTQLPIPKATLEQQAPIVDLVEQILVAKKASVGFDSAQPTKSTQPTNRSLSGVEGNIPALEAEIDRLVYALYGLTDEEIVVVEGKKC